MNLTTGQMNLLVLVSSIVMVYYFYPEYTWIIIPIFTAITLYFSSDDVIKSMFANVPVMSTAGDYIIKYKNYIIIALIAVGVYFTNEFLQKKHHDSTLPSSTDYSSSGSSSFRGKSSTRLRSPSSTRLKTPEETYNMVNNDMSF